MENPIRCQINAANMQEQCTANAPPPLLPPNYMALNLVYPCCSQQRPLRLAASDRQSVSHVDIATSDIALNRVCIRASSPPAWAQDTLPELHNELDPNRAIYVSSNPTAAKQLEMQQVHFSCANARVA